MSSNPKQRFCEQFVRLRGEPMSFAGRPYLEAIYACIARNMVLRCSRQTEKSTFLANVILYEATRRPGTSILFVSPRQEQAFGFVRSRLWARIQESPLLSRLVIGPRPRKLSLSYTRFQNGSELFVRAAFRSADAARGISADVLLVDEFQDIAPGDLPVLQETLSHSSDARTILTGTPKLVDNHLDEMFRQSTANEWTVRCPDCGHGVVLDERALGPTALNCPKCTSPIDVRTGLWVPRNPDATWGAGYWINHCMAPWVEYDQVLERQRVYDLARFKNEVLGLPTSLGDHVVTREQLEACCVDRPMAQSLNQIPYTARGSLIAGIDWGGGGTSRTVLVIGHLDREHVFHVYRYERFRVDEDPKHVVATVAQRCKEFGVRLIGADGGGNGTVYNQLLAGQLRDQLGESILGLYAMYYSSVYHEPQAAGSFYKWTIDRSHSIGGLMSRVHTRRITFPRVDDVGTFLDEFACEFAEYDDLNRTVSYKHPDGKPDDALHATNYAHTMACRWHPTLTPPDFVDPDLLELGYQ